MSDAFNDASKQFMTTYGAYALQSRVALYFGEWNKVVTAAEAVINSGMYKLLIWQILLLPGTPMVL